MFSKFFRSLWPGGDSESRQKNRKRRLERPDTEIEGTPSKKRPKPVIPDEDLGHSDGPAVRVADWVTRNTRTFCESYYVRKIAESPRTLMNKLRKNEDKKVSDRDTGPRGHHPPSGGDHRRYYMPPENHARSEPGHDVHYGNDIMSAIPPMQVHSTPLNVPSAPPPVGYSFTESNFDLASPNAFTFTPGNNHANMTKDEYKFQAPSALPPRYQDRTFQPVQQLHRPPIRPGHDEPPSYNRPSNSRYSSMYDKTYRNHSRSRHRFGDSRNKSKLAAKESIRLEERNRYAELLQQFTTTPLPGTAFGSSFIRRQSSYFGKAKEDTVLGTPVIDLGPDCMSKSNQQSAIPTSREQVSPNRTLTSQRITSRSRISTIPVPEDKHEKRPSAVQRSMVTIDLTESGDELNESRNNNKVTPRESEVMVIDGDSSSHKTRSTASSANISRTPSTSSNISLSLQQSKYLDDNWFQDFRKKFSSDTRKIDSEARQEEIKNKYFKERREDWDKDLEKRIRTRLRLSEKERSEAEEVYIESSEEEEEEEVIIEEEDEFPALTDEQESRVDAAFVPYPPDQVLSEGFKLQIRREDIQTLKGLQWLNDEVINFYMNMIVDRGTQEGRPKVHAFNTFFYPKIMSGGQPSVKRWTKKIDVFAMDYILVPVHLGMHWCLAVIDFPKKQIRYFDSMGGNNKGCLEALRKYLVDEHMDKKKERFDVSDWKLITDKNIPQQMNGSDCGMFTCKFAEYVTRNAEFTFTQEHMPYFRRRMVCEILEKKLL